VFCTCTYGNSSLGRTIVTAENNKSCQWWLPSNVVSNSNERTAEKSGIANSLKQHFTHISSAGAPTLEANTVMQRRVFDQSVTMPTSISGRIEMLKDALVLCVQAYGFWTTQGAQVTLALT
jgi:hypothetical protein